MLNSTAQVEIQSIYYSDCPPFLVLLTYLVVGWIKNVATKLGLSSVVDSETAEKEEYIYFQGIKATVPLFFVSTQQCFIYEY